MPPTPPLAFLEDAIESMDDLCVAPIYRRIASDFRYDEEVAVPERDITAGCSFTDCIGSCIG